MKYHTNFITAAILSTTFVATAAFAADETAQTVVATVNGTPITLGHVIATRSGLPQQYQELADDQLYSGILEQIIQQELLKQSVKELDQEIELQIENQQRTVIAGAALQSLAENAVTDELVQAAYDEKFAGFEPSREFNAAHILVETKEEAMALVTELEGGAEFAALAREKSTGPSGPNGGDLGWFGLGMMVPEFEVAVTEMEVEGVSAPVETQFGWHVIRLNDTRLQDVPDLADVRDELAADIEDNSVRASLEALEENAIVDRVEGIAPAAMRDDTLLGN
jgi:peptidyl-prolyl cis-trans isomerase C